VRVSFLPSTLDRSGTTANRSPFVSSPHVLFREESSFLALNERCGCPFQVKVTM